MKKGQDDKKNATKLTFPYTMHCPKCKVKIKVKSPEMIHKIISCPKCTKKIEVVTPEEDGYIPYGVTPLPPEAPEPEPTEEDLEAIEEEERKVRRAKNWELTKNIFHILFLLTLFGGASWLFYSQAILGFKSRPPEEKSLYKPPR